MKRSFISGHALLFDFGVRSMKRSRTEVILGILSVANEGAGKTRLMYKVNMNFASFDKYLRELKKACLFVELDGSHGEVVYRTTERGENLLRLLKKAEKLICL